MASCGLRLTSEWYADDGSLVTNSIEEMIALLNIVEQFSEWSGIHLNVGKCKITAYIQSLQSLRIKRKGTTPTKPGWPTSPWGGQRIGVLTQDEPLPG